MRLLAMLMMVAVLGSAGPSTSSSGLLDSPEAGSSRVRNASHVGDLEEQSPSAHSEGTADVGAGSSEIRINMIGRYDSADTAVILRVDTAAHTVTLRNHDTGRNYTLTYDNATHIVDAYAREISAQLLSPGQLADVTFLKSSKHLNSLVLASGGESFTMTDVMSYSMPAHIAVLGPDASSLVRIGSENYQIDQRALILIGEEEGMAQSILSGDVVTFTGVGHEIYGVQVTRGHGYLSLSSTSVNGRSLAGAWIELDNKLIRKITEGMLMSVPEGDYTVYILGNGANYATDITITRDEETVLDTSQIPIEPIKTSEVTFDITPSNATLYVDGHEAMAGQAMTLDYGIHLIELTAPGYQSMARYLRVGSKRATVRLEMTAGSDVSGNSTYGSVTSTNQTTSNDASAYETASPLDQNGEEEVNVTVVDETRTDTDTGSETLSAPDTSQTVTGYRIYIDKPLTAQLYLDGNYIGNIPTSFDKVTGTHTLTLKQDGYKTVSYQITIDDTKTDKTYNFPEMLYEGGGTSGDADSPEGEPSQSPSVTAPPEGEPSGDDTTPRTPEGEPSSSAEASSSDEPAEQPAEEPTQMPAEQQPEEQPTEEPSEAVDDSLPEITIVDD